MSYEEIRELAEKAVKEQFASIPAYRKLGELERTLMLETWVNGFLEGQRNQIERNRKETK